MLKKVIDRVTEEIVACEFDPNKIFKLTVQLQTLSKAMGLIPGYQREDAFFAVFPDVTSDVFQCEDKEDF